MRLLFINTLYCPHVAGGAELVCQNQAEMMAARGHEVAVLTIGPKQGVITESINGVRVFRVGHRNIYFHFGSRTAGPLVRSAWHLMDIYNVPMKREAARVLAQWKPDIAVCHNIAGWSISLWTAIRDAGVPIVQILHDQYLMCFRSNMFREERCRSQCAGCRLARLPHRGASRQVDSVVGVSEFILDKMLRNGYFGEATLRRSVVNATDLDIGFLPLPVPTTQLDIRFGFIGSLTRSKGIEWLLETFARLANPAWTLRIAGTGDARYVASLRERFEGSAVQFLGRVPRADFYTTVDACIVPSLWEDTLPSVVFESLLFGVPVIATALGGIPEMLSDGRQGILLDADEPTSLARALQRFADERTHWQGLASSIQRDAIARFGDVDRWAGTWEAVYEATADRKLVRAEPAS